MDLSIEEMEQLGVIDYYLTLTHYISNFVNINYPVTMEDMAAIISDKDNDNTIKRKEVFSILKKSMFRILRSEADDNRKRIEAWSNGIYIPAVTVEEQNKKISLFVQRMLEDLWNYQYGVDNVVENNDNNKSNGRK